MVERDSFENGRVAHALHIRHSRMVLAGIQPKPLLVGGHAAPVSGTFSAAGTTISSRPEGWDDSLLSSCDTQHRSRGYLKLALTKKMGASAPIFYHLMQ